MKPALLSWKAIILLNQEFAYFQPKHSKYSAELIKEAIQGAKEKLRSFDFGPHVTIVAAGLYKEQCVRRGMQRVVDIIKKDFKKDVSGRIGKSALSKQELASLGLSFGSCERYLKRFADFRKWRWQKFGKKVRRPLVKRK